MLKSPFSVIIPLYTSSLHAGGSDICVEPQQLLPVCILHKSVIIIIILQSTSAVSQFSLINYKTILPTFLNIYQFVEGSVTHRIYQTSCHCYCCLQLLLSYICSLILLYCPLLKMICHCSSLLSFLYCFVYTVQQHVERNSLTHLCYLWQCIKS